MTDGVDDAAVADVDVAGVEGDATDQSSTPWDSYLDEHEIPPGFRGPTLEAMKYVESQRSKKFQEYESTHKQFEQYRDIGIHDWEPESLRTALAITEALDQRDPDALRQIVEYYGYELPDGLGDEDEGDEDEGGDVDEGPDLDSLLDERLAPLNEFVQSEMQKRAKADAEQYIESALSAIEKDLGRSLKDGERDRLFKMAAGLAQGGSQDSLAEAWDLQKQIVMDAEKGFLASKAGEPGAAEVGPSAPSVQGKDYSGMSLEDAKQQQLRDWVAANVPD
jgi:hypothetical protein